MATNRVPLSWTTVWADNTTEAFIPATPWMEAADAQYARAAWEIHHIGADLQIQPAWQVADSEDSPGSTGLLHGAWKSGNGVYYPENGWQTLVSGSSADTDAKMLVRFGWKVKRSSGAGLTMGCVAGVVEYQSR